MCAQNHRWGLGPIETSNSCAKVAVLHAQKHRWRLEPIRSFYSCAKYAVMCGQNHRWGLGSIQTCKSGHKVAVLQGEKKTQMKAGTHIDLSFWCKSRCFACTKGQVRSGNHWDLLFRSKSRCFASKNRSWGLGPIQTSKSDANHAVLNAKNTGKVFDPQRLVILALKLPFCVHKTTGEGWNQYSLFILALSTR